MSVYVLLFLALQMQYRVISSLQLSNESRRKVYLVHSYNEHRILPHKIQRTIEDHAFSPVIVRSEVRWQSVFPNRRALESGFPRHRCAHWFLGMTGLLIACRILFEPVTLLIIPAQTKSRGPFLAEGAPKECLLYCGEQAAAPPSFRMPASGKRETTETRSLSMGSKCVIILLSRKSLFQNTNPSDPGGIDGDETK